MGLLRQTEGDRATGAVGDAIDALERGDADGAVTYVVEDYLHDGLDRRGLRALAAGVMQYYGPPRVRVLDSRVTVAGDVASCRLMVIASASGAGGRRSGRSQSEWTVALRKSSGRWYIYQISPVTFNGRPVADLPTLCSHIPRQ